MTVLWYISLQRCAKYLFGHDCLTHSYYCRNAMPICTSLQTSLKQINVCFFTKSSLTDSRTKQTTTKNTDLQPCLKITDRPLDDNDRERTYNNGTSSSNNSQRKNVRLTVATEFKLLVLLP